VLSRPELEGFFRDGYAGPFDLPPEIIEPYRERTFVESVFKYFRTQVNAGAHGFSDTLRNQHVYSKALCRLASETGILSRVSSILGPDLLLWLAHVAPRLAGETGQWWHVDADNRYVRGVHVSIALSDNSIQNGCLQVIPGSQYCRASLDAADAKGFIDRWDSSSVIRYLNDVARWTVHEIKPMSIRSGQYFLMSEGLWHYVGANKTPAYRLNIVARYARPDVMCRDYGYGDSDISRGDLLPCILVSGKDQFGINRLVPAPRNDIFNVSNSASS
jgi:Phytanoyl-CoA dioxygenase (PhyH)